MNGMTWGLSVCGMVLCLSSTGASAVEPGFYVTASLGIGDENPKSVGTNVAGSFGILHVEPDRVGVDDGQLARGAGLGYRVNRYLAGEVEYVDFGTTDVTEHYTVSDPAQPSPVPTAFTLNHASRVTGPAVSLLGTLPVARNVELYLRGGALFTSREYRTGLGGPESGSKSTVWIAGAGVTWSFAKHWAFRAEYQQTGRLGESLTSGETRLHRMSLGALFML